MYLAVLLSLLAAPAAERSPAQEGKVLILASADLALNEFLAQGAEYAPNASFLVQTVEAFCLDQRILLADRVKASEGKRKISAALEEILRQHPDPIAVTYYASSAIPASHAAVRAETTAALGVIAGASGGRLSVEVIDPEKKARQLGGEKGKEYLSDLEKRGIARVSTSSDPQPGSSDLFYSALEVRSGRRRSEVVARHLLPARLENELAKRVLLLGRGERPRVVFFDGRREARSGPAQKKSEWIQASSHEAVLKSLGELFKVDETELREGDSLSESGDPISCLIVAQPHDLQERQVYEIQWAVTSGIPTIFLVSFHGLDISEAGLKESYPLVSLRPELGTLFLSWGVTLGSDLVASNVCGSLPVPRQLKGKKEMVRAPRPLPVLVKSKGESLRRSHPLLSGIGELVFPATGGLTVAKDELKKAGLKITVLADSGKESFSVRLFGLKSELAFKQEKSPRPTSNQKVGAPKQEKAAPDGPPAVLRMKELSEPRKSAVGFGSPRPLAILLEGKFPRRAPGLAVPPWESRKSEGGSRK